MTLFSKDQKHKITFTLNGESSSAHAEPRMLLSDFLRQEIGLRGVHVGCEHGVCGCCTVRVDGKLARSCLMYAPSIDGSTVETVEGLADDNGELNDLQESFKRHHGLQCGQCTPGILMSATAFLEVNPDPSEDEVRDMLSGHLCRCTGYTGMIKAIIDVAQIRKTGSP